MFDHELIEGEELRDVFACAALIGIIMRGEHTNPWEMARSAYNLAQIMVEVREKQNAD